MQDQPHYFACTRDAIDALSRRDAAGFPVNTDFHIVHGRQGVSVEVRRGYFSDKPRTRELLGYLAP